MERSYQAVTNALVRNLHWSSYLKLTSTDFLGHGDDASIGVRLCETELCVLLQKIFKVRRLINIISNVCISVLLVWMLAFFFAFLFACPGHSSAFWKSAKARVHYCWKTREFLFAYCFSDLWTDLIVYLMPIPCVGSRSQRTPYNGLTDRIQIWSLQ